MQVQLWSKTPLTSEKWLSILIDLRQVTPIGWKVYSHTSSCRPVLWYKSIPSRIEKMMCGVLLPWSWIPVCLVGGLCILSLLVSCCTGNGSPQNPSTVYFWDNLKLSCNPLIFCKTHQTTEKDQNGHSAINEKQAEKATDYPSFYITLTEFNKS